MNVKIAYMVTTSMHIIYFIITQMDTITLNTIISELYETGHPERDDFDIFINEELQPHHHYKVCLRILQDHMIFIDKRSKIYANEANQYLNRILQLKREVTYPIRPEKINNQVIDVIEDVRNFKRNILADLLSGPPQIQLPPTFISHMLNELEKFRFMFYYFKAHGELPPVNTLNEHKLWLLDIEGHLGGIHDNLDAVEKLLRKRLCKQQKVFKALHAKTLEFIGYIKHGVVGGNHLSQLDSDSSQAVMVYLNLVREVLQFRDSNLALGTIDSHMLLHMIFEEIYYLRLLTVAAQNYDPLPDTQMKLDQNSLMAIQMMPK